MHVIEARLYKMRSFTWKFVKSFSENINTFFCRYLSGDWCVHWINTNKSIKEYTLPYIILYIYTYIHFAQQSDFKIDDKIDFWKIFQYCHRCIHLMYNKIISLSTHSFWAWKTNVAEFKDNDFISRTNATFSDAIV